MKFEYLLFIEKFITIQQNKLKIKIKFILGPTASVIFVCLLMFVLFVFYMEISQSTRPTSMLLVHWGSL
jgi:uncharacterized membrane protein YvbJ